MTIDQWRRYQLGTRELRKRQEADAMERAKSWDDIQMNNDHSTERRIKRVINARKANAARWAKRKVNP